MTDHEIGTKHPPLYIYTGNYFPLIERWNPSLNSSLALVKGIVANRTKAGPGHNCSPGPVFSRCFWHVAAIYSSPGYVPGGWEAAWRETLIHSLPGQILHKPAPAECRLMSQMVQIRDSTCNLKWQICVLQTRSVVWMMTHKIHACVVHKTDACVNSDYGR